MLVCAALPAADEWTTVAACSNLTGNLGFSCNWNPASGLRLRISSLDGRRTALLEIKKDDSRTVLNPEKSFPPGLAGGGQYNLDALPAAAADELPAVLKIRQELWALHIRGRPIAVFPAPFHEPVNVELPAGSVPAPEKRNPRFQRVEDFKFEDSFLVPEEQEQKLAHWDIVSGSWLLHTALDSATEHGAFKGGKKTLQAAYSPNFYSLKGSGTNAVIAAGHEFYDCYTVESSVQVMPGEMGLVFYLNDEGFHAFTARMIPDSNEVLLRLWKYSPLSQPPRTAIAAVKTQMTPGQWAKLKVRIFQNRVQCLMDNAKLIDTPIELGVGGKFGLIADSSSGIRFDDFAARSNHDLDFLGINDIRRYTLAESGSILPKRRFFSLFPPRDKGNILEPAKSDSDQWLVLGSTEHAGHLISAAFEPSTRSGSAGLLLGYTGEEKPFWRFVRKWTPAGEQFLLEEVSGRNATVREDITLPAAKESETPSPFILMSDATGGKEIRLYRNDELVLIHHLPSPVRGASGIHVGPDTKTKIFQLEYKLERDDLYRNRFEKNRIFIDDPFMRHWSSPEGQWIDASDKSMWHKGDFFGRFNLHMPYIEGTEIHLGVLENSSNGTVVVSAANNSLRLLAGGDAGNPKATPLASAPATSLVKSVYHDGTNPPDAKDKPKEKEQSWYTASYEGYWLCLMSGDKLLFKRKLDKPLAGRKARIAGFQLEQLKYSFVERFNVKDYLFTESLFDWTINGGSWEVVNRFNCDPRWSHMNGENTNGIAGLWTKYSFKGDFCVELFAGIRHGYYQRCGDINVTVLNAATTPSQGYTVTLTGWDPDHSQLYTRFFRNGKEIGVTDKYLVPRFREGNKRKGYDPLVKFGGTRDVHGAWYYIKFRRIGNKLEYYFDNELAFTAEDGQPIPEGSFGLWTFLNSMMVARVKIAAEEIRPKTFAFATVPPDTQLQPPADSEQWLARYTDIKKDNRTLESSLPQVWDASDEVGDLALSYYDEPGLGPYFVARNVQGSGNMYAKYTMPPVPYTSVAGWHFYVKRTPGAQFNFHFSVGRIKDGKYLPERFFYHRISGSDLSFGPYVKYGETPVAPVEENSSDWHRKGEWQPVEVWVPAEELRELQNTQNLQVQVDGFGLLQPSYELEGLSGNAPGESYAIRDFSEIRCSQPVFALAPGLPSSPSFTILNPRTGKLIVACNDTDALNDWIRSFQGSGLNRVLLQTTRTNSVAKNDLAWLKLPSKPEITCNWHDKIPDAVLLQGNRQYPDPRLTVARISLEKADLPVVYDGPGRLLALLPRKEPSDGIKINSFVIKATTEAGVESFPLARKLRPAPAPPVLLSLTGPTPLFENFERREIASPVSIDRSRARIEYLDPLQGSFLRVCNRETGQRLNTRFHVGLKLSKHPVFQFRYRGPVMAKVSVGLGGAHFAAFSEPNDRAAAVRFALEPKMDNQWHTWCGMVSDAVKAPASANLPFSIYDTGIGSANDSDQTGRYTSWNIDDVAYGPAVSSADQLAFTPKYFSYDNVTSVCYAVSSDPAPFMDLPDEKRLALAWKPAANNQKTVPDVSSATNGLCHLLIKAADDNGLESAVADVPFLFDNRPVEPRVVFEKTVNPICNGTMLSAVFKTHGGAPLDVENMKLKWNDKNYQFHIFGSSYAHSPDSDRLLINWPYIFREALNDTTNGQTVTIALADVADGAGNKTPDILTPLTIDYAADTTPPTLLPTTYPTSVLFHATWENPADSAVYFLTDGPGIQLVRSTNEAPYLAIDGSRELAKIWYAFNQLNWTIGKYPYLTFRIRRPVVPTNDTATFSIYLDMGKQNIIPIILSGAATNTNTCVFLPSPIEWQSNNWCSVFLNLSELLKDRLTTGEIRSYKVRSMGFAVTNKAEKCRFHLQDFFIYGDWERNYKFKLNGYDASGIGGTAWSFEGTSTQTEFTPDGLTSETGPGWVAMRLRDKAGNLSNPVRLPICSAASLPTGSFVLQDQR